jgi:hypothetical protein
MFLVIVWQSSQSQSLYRQAKQGISRLNSSAVNNIASDWRIINHLTGISNYFSVFTVFGKPSAGLFLQRL